MRQRDRPTSWGDGARKLAPASAKPPTDRKPRAPWDSDQPMIQIESALEPVLWSSIERTAHGPKGGPKKHLPKFRV